jgi:acyl-CoA thioester hydrolase
MTRIPPNRVRQGYYPFVTPVLARYADVDPLWHINNVAIAQYFEETRISMLREILAMERVATPAGRLILARQSIDYVREGRYPGDLEARAAIGKVGRTSVTIVLALFQDEECVALSDAVLVRLDQHGPIPWTDDERKVLEDPVWHLQPEPTA